MVRPTLPDYDFTPIEGTMFNEDIAKNAIDLASIGMSQRSIAHRIGVSVNTLQDWLDNRPNFSAAFRQAQTDPEYANRTRLREHIDDTEHPYLSAKAIDLWEKNFNKDDEKRDVVQDFKSEGDQYLQDK